METLAEELLVKIFSYFTWSELKLLSLVNRRWYRVTGTSSFVESASLTLSRVSRLLEDSYIDERVLVSSQRQYSGVSFSLSCTGDILIQQVVLGRSLAACLNKWKIMRMRIKGQYDQVLRFFQRFGDLLTNIVELSIVLEQFSTLTCYAKNDEDGCFLELEKLQRFSWIELSLPNYTEAMPHSFVFVVPQLHWMRVHRMEKSAEAMDNNLMLFDCTKLKEVEINSYGLLESSLFDSEFLTLEQLTVTGTRGASFHLSENKSLLQKLNYIDLTGCSREALDVVISSAINLKVLKLSRLSGWINFNTGFQQLYEIRLASLQITSSTENILIEFPNLRKLTILHVKFTAALEIEAPSLVTLVVDQLALRYAKLKSCETLHTLGIARSNEVDLSNADCPVYPNVTHLYLNLSELSRSSSDGSLGRATNSYRQIRKLTIMGGPTATFDRLAKLLDRFPLLESLHFHSIGFITFSSFEPHAENSNKIRLKRLIITNSTFHTTCLSVFSSIDWIRFYRVRIGGLFPGDLWPPLIRDEPEGQNFFLVSHHYSHHYSTLGFRFDEDNEMLNW